MISLLCGFRMEKSAHAAIEKSRSEAEKQRQVEQAAREETQKAARANAAKQKAEETAHKKAEERRRRLEAEKKLAHEMEARKKQQESTPPVSSEPPSAVTPPESAPRVGFDTVETQSTPLSPASPDYASFRTPGGKEAFLHPQHREGRSSTVEMETAKQHPYDSEENRCKAEQSGNVDSLPSSATAVIVSAETNMKTIDEKGTVEQRHGSHHHAKDHLSHTLHGGMNFRHRHPAPHHHHQHQSQHIDSDSAADTQNMQNKQNKQNKQSESNQQEEDTEIDFAAFRTPGGKEHFLHHDEPGYRPTVQTQDAHTNTETGGQTAAVPSEPVNNTSLAYSSILDRPFARHHRLKAIAIASVIRIQSVARARQVRSVLGPYLDEKRAGRQAAAKIS